MTHKEKIRNLIKKAGLTEGQIADKLGFSRQTLSYHFQKPDITLDLYHKILELLPPEVDELNIPQDKDTELLVNLLVRILARNEVILEYVGSTLGSEADLVEINNRIAAKEKEIISGLKDIFVKE